MPLHRRGYRVRYIAVHNALVNTLFGRFCARREALLYSLASMTLQVGSLLYNRYRILAELGRGGMGAVYHGHDENLGVDVAIKENLFVSPQFAQQFRREATLLAGLRHPNLPRVTDHFVIPC